MGSLVQGAVEKVPDPAGVFAALHTHFLCLADVGLRLVGPEDAHQGVAEQARSPCARGSCLQQLTLFQSRALRFSGWVNTSWQWLTGFSRCAAASQDGRALREHQGLAEWHSEAQ